MSSNNSIVRNSVTRDRREGQRRAMKVPKEGEITSGLMVRENFLERKILMKNRENLASTIVGTNILGGNETRSKAPKAAMHGYIWKSHIYDREESEKRVRPSFSV